MLFFNKHLNANRFNEVAGFLYLTVDMEKEQRNMKCILLNIKLPFFLLLYSETNVKLGNIVCLIYTIYS